MSTIIASNNPAWRATPLVWLALGLTAMMVGVVFHEGLKEMVRVWETKEEYSYGYLIPFIALFLIWQKKDSLERIPFEGSWAGVILLLAGLALFVLGNLSALYLIVQYAFLFVLFGIVLSLLGWVGFKVIWVPLVVLLFMIPLPQFFLAEISQSLQLISSAIGVAFIRLFGISVFLEGNVIDLGSFQLQVVEACSGLRYLFPLMTLGFIAAYFFKGALWKRAVIFLSTIPITVLMNSFRIGAIGVMVEYWGPSMAEGFLHDFEGWAVFMACTGVLLGEMWILARIGKDRLPLREAFGLDFPAPTPKDAEIRRRTLPRPFMVALVVIAGTVILIGTLPERVEIRPERKDFSVFPLELGEWKGKGDRLEQIYLNELKLDDYLIADFVGSRQKHPVNLYIAYYGSQKKGESAHSPRTCIPGGGWEISSLTQKSIPGIDTRAGPLQVNRAVIQMGENKQLTYYWFQQRGRVITNEYLVKWFIFWDALTRKRTDGSLVRLVTPVTPEETIEQGDRRLEAFARTLYPVLRAYVPD